MLTLGMAVRMNDYFFFSKYTIFPVLDLLTERDASFCVFTQHNERAAEQKANLFILG